MEEKRTSAVFLDMCPLVMCLNRKAETEWAAKRKFFDVMSARCSSSRADKDVMSMKEAAKMSF